MLTGMKTMANTCTPDAKLDAEVEVKQSNNACCQSVDSNSLCILLPSDPLQLQEGTLFSTESKEPPVFEALILKQHKHIQ